MYENKPNGEPTDGKQRISVEPAPSWVVRAKVRNFERKNGEPVTCLLSERRVHVPSRTIYSRRVTRLEGSQAVQQCSRVELPFDPLTRSLAIHGISIFRGGVLTNHASLSEIELIRREQRLEAGILNGEVSALQLLRDVRTGDILDVEYSVHDNGALFENEMSWFQSASEVDPVGDWSLMWIDAIGSEPRIFNKADHLSYEEEVTENLLIRKWSARAMEPQEPEPRVPNDILAFPFLQISPFHDWKGIVNALLGKWDFEPASRHELDAELDSIRAQGQGDPLKVLDAAVASARDAVRYQNYSPGVLAMVPANLSDIWHRRWGDCKEKSLLLTWLLRQCGFSADPVLVHSVMGGALPGLLPSPQLFDHVVTCVTLADRILWIDPTDTYRGGRPSSWTTLPFGHGLPFSVNSSGLVPIPAEKPGATSVKIQERILASGRSRAANYEFKFTFQGQRADFMRGLMDSQGTAGVKKLLKGLMEITRPGIELKETCDFSDHRERNCLTVDLKGFSERAVREGPNASMDFLPITPFSFAGFLPGVERLRRVHPLWLGNPDMVEHEIEVHHPEYTRADYPTQVVSNPLFKAEVVSRTTNKRPVFRFTWALLQDRVKPADLARYKDQLDKVYAMMDVFIYLPPTRVKKSFGPEPSNRWGEEKKKWGT